jgi:hypothetical protein
MAQDELRTFRLFGKLYWWDRDGGRLVLRRAAWIQEARTTRTASCCP